MTHQPAILTGPLCRTCLLALLLALLPAAAHAQSQPAASSAITCEGPVGKDASHAALVKTFGAANVTGEEIDGAEGEKYKVTVLFAKDPGKRLVVGWQNEAARAKPAGVSVGASPVWTGPLGIRVGMSLEEIAKINGRPITINGFQWDYGGYAIDLKGKLAELPGGCGLMLRFEPGIDLPSGAKYKALIGEKKIRSDNALLLSVKPRLSEWSISFDE